MASYNGSSHPEPAKMEQIITEIFPKSLHIILESRCPYVSSRSYSVDQGVSSPSPSPSSSSPSSIRPRDKWFNLALKDCPAALENIDFWRQSNYDPMVVDVVLVKRSNDWESSFCSPRKRGVGKKRILWDFEKDEFGGEAKDERIIERWIVQYEGRKSSNSGGGNLGKKSGGASSSTVYKKSILLLRSLYVMVKLLPAYRVFRDLMSSARIRMYNICHRIHSFVKPFTHREEAEMQKFVFTPVDTSCGRLCLSVMYRSSVSDVSSEPSTPLSPQFIPDYVGSPLTDRLRRFPSVSDPQSSPSDPFGRRHSWSYELYPSSPPSVIPSPSPTYSESRAMISQSQPKCLPPSYVPRRTADETPQLYEENTGFHEYWPSFSPSSSPSPPTHIPGISKVRLRSESVPLSQLSSRLSGIPSPPMRFVPPNAHKSDGRSGLLQTSSAAAKLSPFGKHEGGKSPGENISSTSSPQRSFSRSSGRLSFRDDYDEAEFSGPFVVDDDEETDLDSRPGSSDLQKRHGCLDKSGGVSPLKKSEDAAVGELICMLNKAPPLCIDSSGSGQTSQGSKSAPLTNFKDPNPIAEISDERSAISLTSSRVHPSKTMAAALEELREYSKMKNVLMKRGSPGM